LIFAAAALGHQALDVFLTALIVVLLLGFVRDATQAWRWTLAGLAMGAAMAVRETVVFFAVFVAAGSWCFPRMAGGRVR
jgi:predicted branched-subunit amino acid permease